MMRLRFGIGIPALTSTFHLAKIAQIIEQLDFDSVWLSDNYATRNAFVGLTHMVLTTKSITVGLGATNPYLVNPAVLASFFGMLNETSEDRCILGIGAGDINMLNDLGIERKTPRSTLREYIQILNELWAGTPLHSFSQAIKMPRAQLQYKVNTPPPIYLAAQGPILIQLAAEIANGVLINAAHPMDYIVAKSQLEKGFAKRDQNKDTFDVTAYSIFSMTDLPTTTHDTRKYVVARIIADAPESILTRHGITPTQVQKIIHFLRKDNLTELAGAVTPEMLDTFAIIGTPEVCISKIERLIKTGVTHIILAPSLISSPRKILMHIHKRIISVFNDSEKL